MIQITRLEKADGPLTKRISVGPDGNLISDGSACIMQRGHAVRTVLKDVGQLGNLIGHLGAHQAIALGCLLPDLPDEVSVTTKSGLNRLNGSARDVIARTSSFIKYRPGQVGPALIDYDAKGMPDEVKARLDEIGGPWKALVSVMPELSSVARVVRRSTSSGIYRRDTGEKLPGSKGLHVYLLLRDGADADRFLQVLHARCWLAGFGWMMVGAGGQLLERSIVDRMVGAAERLVFEGAPVLEPPLAQDEVSRQPVIFDGSPLDTSVACPPLTLVQQACLGQLRGKEAHRLAPHSAKAKAAFIKVQSRKLIERTGLSLAQAERVIERQCQGILLPTIALPFDDPDLVDVAVSDVIVDPDRFVGETLADPLEGVEYGSCKAKVMRRADGTLWIHSFAHGRTTYELKRDAAAIEAALNGTPPNDTPALFVKLVLDADLESDEVERMRDLTAARSGVTKRSIERKLKNARQEGERQRVIEDRHRRLAERCDPRPQIQVPPPDAPWLPQMQALNDVLGSSRDIEPPARDVDGYMVAVRERRLPNMHALTADGANAEDAEDTRLPAPAQPLITRLDEPKIAEVIERHIDYVSGEDNRSVHLGTPFVKHYQTRIDDALPIVSAVATLPIVLRDGTLLAKRGLDRGRGIVFRVPDELLAILPRPEDCTPSAVAEAMRFLVDEWFCDVLTSYEGKATLIAAACTLIQRSLLADRPVFFLTAPRRGGGKTTTLIMLLMAVTGRRPSAAAWSTSDEERRKALLAYLLEGAPCIIWDNIIRGSQISCPHIERACTTDLYTDRRLGVSENVAASASTIQFFTGNNVGPRGEMASRALKISIEVDRADPENREFKHTDPIGWTESNRGRILSALYTILMGNPNLTPGSNTHDETRFHLWWRMIGSAVEHAAKQHTEQHAEAVAAMVVDADAPGAPRAVSFKDLFLSQEEDDEDSASLADVLVGLAGKWKSSTFPASEVARLVNDHSDYSADVELSASLREFLFPNFQVGQTVSTKAVSNRLKIRLGEPVKVDDRTLCLKTDWDTANKVNLYYVMEKKDG